MKKLALLSLIFIAILVVTACGQNVSPAAPSQTVTASADSPVNSGTGPTPTPVVTPVSSSIMTETAAATSKSATVAASPIRPTPSSNTPPAATPEPEVSLLPEPSPTPTIIAKPTSLPQSEQSNWTVYSDSNQIKTLFASGNDIWAGTYGGAVKWDLSAGTYSKYTTTEGLAQNEVRSITRDQKGNLWFATRYGISVYNGVNWDSFAAREGLSQDDVLSVFADDRGQIWVGTDHSGVCMYDGQMWEKFTDRDGLPNNQIYTICQDNDGNLWFGTNRGIASYDGNVWTVNSKQNGLADDTVVQIFKDRQGNLWCNHMTDSVSYYDGKQWHSMPIGGGPDRYSMIGSTTGIAQDKTGRLLFCTSSSGVWVYDDNTWYRLPDSPKDCIAIAVDDRDSIYLGSWNSGIYLYQDNKWSHWKTADGLTGNGIRSINQDNDGTIWVGTERGASCFNGAEWKSFTIENGFPAHEVQTITKDKEGTIWFGINGGVCRYDGTNWRYMLVNTGENNTGWASNYVLAMCQDREGNLWAATMTGVSRYDGVKWQSTLSLIPEDGIFIKDIVQDKIGRICIVFRDETVKVYDGKDWNTLSTMHRDYLTQDADGILWFSDHRYFYSYDGANWNTLEIEGVSSGDLRNFFKARDGSIWIVTYGYIYRYDGERLEKYTLQDGPCEYFVNSIFEDNSGNIWFGAASSGIFVYTPPK